MAANAPWENDPIVSDPNAGRGVYGSGGFEDQPPQQVAPADDNSAGYIDPQTGRLTINITADRQPAPDTRPTSFWEGALQGAEKPLNNGAQLLENGLNMVQVGGKGLGDQINSIGPSLGLAGSVEDARAQQGMRNDAASSQPSALGQFVGNVAALSLLPGGVLTQGALGGALNSDDQSLSGLATGAAMGAAGGKLAEIGLRGTAQAASPVISDGLRTLINAGVRVTPGQVARSADTGLGNLIARSEDRAISTPFVGDSIVAARNRSFDDFGRAAVNRSLEPIGDALPANIRTGRQAIQYAGDRLSSEYDRILPNIQATGDQQFIQDLAQIHAGAQSLAPGRADQFNRILNDLGRYWQQGSTLDGDAFKAIETRLGQRARRYQQSPDADQQDLGDALASVQDAVRQLAARQNPQYAPQISAVNRGWAGLAQVEKASLNSRGNITPAGYSQAVKQSSATVRRRGYARGQALNQDLSDAASDILPSEIADSGTAGRWQQSNPLALALGAAQAPAYAAAHAATPIFTRDSYTSPAIAALLRLGARNAAPIAVAGAPTVIGSNP